MTINDFNECLLTINNDSYGIIGDYKIYSWQVYGGITNVDTCNSRDKSRGVSSGVKDVLMTSSTCISDRVFHIDFSCARINVSVPSRSTRRLSSYLRGEIECTHVRRFMSPSLDWSPCRFSEEAHYRM